MFIDAAFSGHSVQEYTNLFDTIYLSLYKSFNSVNGAILAGSKHIIDNLTQEHRMFGAGLPSSWQQIAIANYFFDGYERRYKLTLKKFDQFKKELEKTGNYKIKSLKNGSNVFKLILIGNITHLELSENLKNNNILFPNWDSKDNCFYFKVNDSLVYNDIEVTISYFIS